MKNLLVRYVGPDAVPLVREPGSTWEWIDIRWGKGSLGRKFRATCAIVSPRQWDAIAIIDDDLAPVGCTWTDIFALFHETGARTAQPALTRDSFASHPVTVQVPGVRWRETNFVEVMCPILGGKIEEDWALLDDAGIIGWGLEALWSNRGRLAILDATPVRHSRAMTNQHNGVDPFQEAVEFHARHGLTPEPERTIACHPTPLSHPASPPSSRPQPFSPALRRMFAHYPTFRSSSAARPPQQAAAPQPAITRSGDPDDAPAPKSTTGAADGATVVAPEIVRIEGTLPTASAATVITASGTGGIVFTPPAGSSPGR